jgi:hypothetical protein
MGSLFLTENRELIRLSDSHAVTEGSAGEVSVMGRRGDREYPVASLYRVWVTVGPRSSGESKQSVRLICKTISA